MKASLFFPHFTLASTMMFHCRVAEVAFGKPKRFDPGNYEPSVARSLPLTAN